MRAINKRGKIITAVVQAVAILMSVQVAIGLVSVSAGNTSMSFQQLLGNLALTTGAGAICLAVAILVTRRTNGKTN